MDGITVRRPRHANARAIRRRGSVVTFHPIASRTLLATQAKSAVGSSIAFLPAVLLFTAADPILGNSFVSSNKDYLFARNVGGSERTVTLRSAPDPVFGRLGDLSMIIEPGGVVVFGPITRQGWAQPNGLIYVDAPATDVELLPMTFA